MDGKTPAGDTTILWFRGADLRLADNPAVRAALEGGGPVVPVYVHDPDAAGDWALGANARAWRAASLDDLDRRLFDRGSGLVVRAGAAERVLADLAGETGASRVVFARRWEPWALAQAERVRDALVSIAVVETPANLLIEPSTLLTKTGTPYRVFTPFWRRWRQTARELDPGATVLGPAPRAIPSPETMPDSLGVHVVGETDVRPLVRGPDVLDEWEPCEGGALERLACFTHEGLAGYHERRDPPGIPGTSRLSPHLAHGEISPARIRDAVLAAGEDTGTHDDAEAFVRQLAWREFAASVLAAEPGSPETPLKPGFERFPWRDDPDALHAWQRGETGYPLVDAGMRELLMTGWMHNRVRMVAASFLTKDLLVPWQEGERWFWDNLVDADLANNAFGWQWVAGSGLDAAPYFRIFNPTSQGRTHDSDGTYVKRWVTQLRDIPARWAHEPTSAPPKVLAEAGVEIGALYPEPIVDHDEARDCALAAYEAVRRG